MRKIISFLKRVTQKLKTVKKGKVITSYIFENKLLKKVKKAKRIVASLEPPPLLF